MANVGIGMKGYLGYGEESSYGVPVSRTLFQEINSESLARSSPLIESRSLYRTGILSSKVAQGELGIGGGVEFDCQYEGWEKLLKHAMGAVATSTPDATNAPSVRRHLFTIADVLPTGLTLEIFRDTSGFASEENKAHVYAGCKVTSLQLACGVGDLLRASFDFIGKNDDRRAKSSESFNTSRIAVYHQGVLTWDGNDAEVSQFSMTLNNQLETRPKLGARTTREPLRNGKVEVTGTFTVEFDKWEKYQHFMDAAEKALNVRFTGPNIVSGYDYFINLSVNIAIITGVRVNLNTPGRIILELDYKAYRSTSINELEVTLQNTTTSI